MAPSPKPCWIPDSREVVETFIAAVGGGIANAWAVAVGNDLDLYASSSNSGLLRLPPADKANPTVLTVDPDDPRIVRDQTGTDRMVSYVTDIDGVARMSNGDIMMTSGSGGSMHRRLSLTVHLTPSFATVRTAVPRACSVAALNPGGGDSVFNNPDVLKVDAEDTLYVTNKGGNVVTVDTAGGRHAAMAGQR